MNLTLVNTARGWRGGERQTLLLAQAFVSMGVNVTCIVRKGEPLAEEVRNANIPFKAVSVPFEYTAALLQHGQRGIVSIQNGSAMSIASRVRGLLRAPIVYSQRMHITRSRLPKRFYTPRATIAVSEYVAQELVALGVPNVTVIPDCVAAVPSRAAVESALHTLQGWGIDPNVHRVIGTTAAFTKPKDPHTTLSVVARLIGDITTMKFLHLGEGELRQGICALAKEMGLEHVYIAPGHVVNAEAYVRCMECFLLTSTQEAFGSSVLDAFQAQVPVVATETQGLAEAVRGRGMLAPVGSVDILADHVRTVLTDPGSSTVLHNVQAGLLATQTTFSVRNVATQYIQVFEKVFEQAFKHEVTNRSGR
jgi:glycosyltransferase involved in cell wall biosynthesis